MTESEPITPGVCWRCGSGELHCLGFILPNPPMQNLCVKCLLIIRKQHKDSGMLLVDVRRVRLAGGLIDTVEVWEPAPMGKVYVNPERYQ